MEKQGKQLPPARIYAHSEQDDLDGTWEVFGSENTTEYIRADIHEEAVKYWENMAEKLAKQVNNLQTKCDELK